MSKVLLCMKYDFTVNKLGNPSRKLELLWETKTGITSFPPWLRGLDSRQQFLPVLAEYTVVLRMKQWPSSLLLSTCSHTVHLGLLNEYSISEDWRPLKKKFVQLVIRPQFDTALDTVDITAEIWFFNFLNLQHTCFFFFFNSLDNAVLRFV